MASTTQARSLTNTLINDNTSEDITPGDLRTVMLAICDVADSLDVENSTGLGEIEDFNIDIPTIANTSLTADRHVLVQYAHYTRQINQLHIEAVVATTTFQVTLYINDVAVTGLTNVNVTSSSRSVANGATGANTMSVGARLTLGIGGVLGSPSRLGGSIRWTRT